MNTINNWITTATIHDEERCELWSEVFPGARVPIQFMLPQWVSVPERGVTSAYMLDLAALTHEQLRGVVMILAKRFGIDPDEVQAELDMGVPILSEGVIVSVKRTVCDE